MADRPRKLRCNAPDGAAVKPAGKRAADEAAVHRPSLPRSRDVAKGGQAADAKSLEREGFRVLLDGAQAAAWGVQP